MLSIIHKKAYQDFLKLLEQWLLAINNSDSTTQNSQTDDIYLEIEKVYCDRIATITDQDMNLADASSWIAIQAEIQREFRLLQRAKIFYQIARQPSTRQDRKAAVAEHIEKLMRYCQTMTQ